MAILLYKHNKKAYDKVTEMFKTKERVAVVHPTGCGKSFISLKWLEDNNDKNCLFVAPNLSIIEQIKKHIIDCEMTMNDFPYLKFITYSKLCRMKDIDMEKFDRIVLDEFHRCGANEWSRGIANLINNNEDAQILGFSATPIRYLDEHRNMAIELFHGNIASEITLEDAMINEILPIPYYISAIYSLNDDIEYYQKRISKVKKIEDQIKAQQYLESAKKILEKSDGLPQIFKKHMKNKSGKYIVFCRNYEHMQKMMLEAKTWFKEVNSNVTMYQMSSFESKGENLKVFEEFYNSNDDSLKLLFSIDMLNEGIHVPNIDGVIMLRPTESPIIFKQQLGRALSVGHNSHPVVFDIVNNITSCEIIDKFFHDLRERALVKFTQTGNKELLDKLETFQITDSVREINEIFQKIDDCLKLEWDDYYNLACEYYKEHGDLLIPANYRINRVNLGYWISDQRKTMKNLGHRQPLTPIQIDKLNNIGMVWDIFREQWNDKYKIAKAWYDEHGNLEGLRNKLLNGINIYDWLCEQVKNYNNGSLKYERIKLLEDIGMVWNKVETRWQDMYEIAKNYYQEHGTLLVVNDEKLNIWLQYQRQVYKGNSNYTPLTQTQIDLLNDIGMIWDVREKSFDVMYEIAKKYYEEHKNLLVPDKYTIDGKKLSDWIKDKRKYYKKGKLSKEQIDKLESIGMIWDVIAYKWNNYYSKALHYYNEHGNLFITSSIDKKLLIWLNKQKELYDSKESLTDDQIRLLDNIKIYNGVGKQKIEKQEKISKKSSWMDMYMQAKKYYEEHENILVPNDSNNIKLYNWIKNQKSKYSSNLLTEEQISLLESIGIVWKITEDKWNLMYDQAKQYKEKFGSLSFPDVRTSQYKNLIVWLLEQKRKYNNKNLSDDQINKLESIGIIWNTNQDYFNTMYKQAKAYYDFHGNLLVPDNEQYHCLAAWIKSMKRNYKNNNLSQDVIDKFEDIGMIWDKLEYQWNVMYEQAKAYYDLHGNLSIPNDSIEHKKLITWIANKKSGYYGKGSCKLTEEQVLKLQLIGLLLGNADENTYTKLEYIKKQEELLKVLKDVLLECKNNNLEDNDYILDEKNICKKKNI